MFDVVLENEYIADIDGTSEGTQVKFYKDDFWYKMDSNGGEGAVEELASIVLSFSSLKDDEYVAYESGFDLDINSCLLRISQYPDCNEKEILLYQLENCRKLFHK